ncbi:MAG: zraS 3 [Holophagaceae bacterium]|nr:zraS 3 [Holophagaceae bacterium]
MPPPAATAVEVREVPASPGNVLGVILPFAVFSVLWITLSDLALGRLVRDAAALALASTLKGFGYVGVSAALLGFLMHRQKALHHGRQQEARQQHRKHEAMSLLLALSEASADVIYVKDLEGRYLVFNREACRVTGLVKEQVLGRTDLELFPESLARQFVQNDQVAKSAGTWVTVEETMRDGEEDRIFQSSKGVLRDSQGEVFALYGISRDITDRQRLHGLMEEVGKLSVKSQMAAYLAHEINNPLAGIRNALQLVERAVPPDHPYLDYFPLINRGMDRIGSSVRTMYQIYRPPASGSCPVPLAKVCEDLSDLLGPRLRSGGVKVRMDFVEPDCTLVANEGLFRQLLFNLLQNAIEASPQGGEVVIGARRDSGGVRVSVRDEGGGISSEMATRVFEPGFTTKHGGDMSGFGMGLSSCRSIMASLGGSLDHGPGLEGRGTCFTAFFPMT